MTAETHSLPKLRIATSVESTGSTPRSEMGRLRSYLGERILGQDGLVDALLIGLLADGHLLVEGAPGLAKTTAVKALADGIEGDHHRVQFTPDLLPADLTGSDVLHAESGTFRFCPGPLFHNLVLADEINRAPAKVQAALLEAMAERQITVGDRSYPLPELFLVMATQNPIEQEGTYPLPEAQLDRFLLHVRVDYPDSGVELDVMRLVRGRESAAPGKREGEPISQETIFAARRGVEAVHVAEPVERYIAELVSATRRPEVYDATLAGSVQWGASPRASLALDRCSRARAWLAGRAYVTPEDVQALAPDALRHRVLLSYEAEADGMSVEDVVQQLIQAVPVP